MLWLHRVIIARGMTDHKKGSIYMVSEGRCRFNENLYKKLSLKRVVLYKRLSLANIKALFYAMSKTGSTGMDLINTTYKDMHIGELIYDWILSNSSDCTLDKITLSNGFKEIYHSIVILERLDKIFQRKSPDYYIVWDRGYNHGIAALAAGKYGAKIVEALSISNIKNIEDSKGSYTPYYHVYMHDKISHMLNTKEYGGLNNYDDISRQFAYASDKWNGKREDTAARLGLDNTKKNAAIFCHCLTDWVHCSEKQLFQDYYTWMRETLVNEISGVVTELQNALACAARIFELIEEEPQLPEKEGAVVLNNVDGTVKLENVSFSYTPEQKLIRDFNLSVKQGQRVAIVGPTGCGKTTVINLLMRFYDVNSGCIRISGTDIREATRASLRTSFGMVLQETWLKSGTIRENLTMGKPDATDDEMIAAAKAAHAHSFIKRLPQGYDTEIGEDGGSLSQGQKQLLCIARVMLSLPPMLILDEATSSIDTRTEIKIQNAFAKMMEGRTSFIVAHRLSTIQTADIILVMKDGNIIEQGNHETLLAKGGFYANLYNSQFAQ